MYVSSNFSFLSVYFKYFIFWLNHSILGKTLLTSHLNIFYWTSYINYLIQNILPLQMTRADFDKHLASHTCRYLPVYPFLLPLIIHLDMLDIWMYFYFNYPNFFSCSKTVLFFTSIFSETSICNYPWICLRKKG